MSLRNRADPFGHLHAVPERGSLMGNRGGCFHRDDKTLKDRQWTSQRWIICQLEFKDRRRQLMRPGHYTELFFLDEATALAGGHRPCFECRRKDAETFRDSVARSGVIAAGASVTEIDRLCAGEIQIVLGKGASRESVSPETLPDGAMYAAGGAAFLIHKRRAYAWSFSGYGPPVPLHPSGTRLTPAVTCAAINNGYQVAQHTSIGSF